MPLGQSTRDMVFLPGRNTISCKKYINDSLLPERGVEFAE